ncbi:uncharacterized protein I206_100561 [Kwoniella pini CBS 10737]|uniref:CS domain-containing protein n=1 Tax=Kwoniella pini CBS 10737 TaxID=1296096 RepID=A0A1B9IDG9_9TREE|nr:uncharacterized protein I206_00764 [Kwoniella pini CBS 10737]OCF53461.1 hypothetical protein I206_00764 [Kwoniella pini CBS 10737]
MAPIHPEVTYAERCNATEPEKNIIYFTINTPDIKGEPKLEIKPTEISFAAKAGDASKGVPEKEYAFDLQLYDEIIPEETKKVITSRAVLLILRKKEPRSEYWLRLTKEKPNRNWVKTDFSKWVDEDEQEGAEDPTAGMDMAGMGGMGGGMPGMEGMGGMGGMGGSMPGMGGMGGMDFSKMMEQMGGMGGMGGGMPDFGAGEDDEGDSDEDRVPEEEEDIEEISTSGAADKGKAKVSGLDDVE